MIIIIIVLRQISLSRHSSANHRRYASAAGKWSNISSTETAMWLHPITYVDRLQHVAAFDVAVFKRSVRSNNDVEGWHRRLNQKASRGQLNMYLLLLLLGTETELLKVQLTFLKELSHIRRQCELGPAGCYWTKQSLSLLRQQHAVNSSQQWQHGVWGAGQLVTTVFQPPVNSSYDFGLWRVDRVTSWLAT